MDGPKIECVSGHRISMALAIRITLPKESVSQILVSWLQHCDQIIAYEHNEANRVHCHVYMVRPAVTTQRLKQISLREERGNQFWSFKTCTGDCTRYITYMSKGKLQPFFHRVNIGEHDPESCYTEDEVEAYRLRWVEPPATKVPKQLTEYLEFETYIDAFPPMERATRDAIRYYARQHCFRKYQMLHQQCKNQIINYTDTYCFKRHIRA